MSLHSMSIDIRDTFVRCLHALYLVTVCVPLRTTYPTGTSYLHHVIFETWRRSVADLTCSSACARAVVLSPLIIIRYLRMPLSPSLLTSFASLLRSIFTIKAAATAHHYGQMDRNHGIS